MAHVYAQESEASDNPGNNARIAFIARNFPGRILARRGRAMERVGARESASIGRSIIADAREIPLAGESIKNAVVAQSRARSLARSLARSSSVGDRLLNELT